MKRPDEATPQFEEGEAPLTEAEIAEGATLDDDERVREAQDAEETQTSDHVGHQGQR